jgi:predicted NBD/HSP70 family sugar kinase
VDVVAERVKRHSPVKRHSAAVAGPAGPRSVRRQNLSLVLRDVMENGPRSRATIAEATGLTKSTVSSLVSDLTARGLLSEAGHEMGGTVGRPGRPGRPGRLVAVSGASVVGLGLEINVDYLSACVLDLTGEVRYERTERRENRNTPVSEVLDALERLGRGALSTSRAAGLTPVGVTIAAPGLVDVDSGTLLVAPNLEWERIPLAAEMSRRLRRRHLPVIADNDANLAALGELWEGEGRRLGDFVHVSGEIGVGAGVVIGGELVRGGAGLGGEFGHIPVRDDGHPCPCGSHGCLERLVGQEALLRAAGLDADIGTRIGVPDGGAAALVARATAGDRATIAALRQAGLTLGTAIATMVNLFAPDSVVLGGMYAGLYEWMIRPLRAELRRRAFVMRHTTVAVVPSRLGEAAAARGAASLALRTVCADPYLLGARA